jgi:hypothetical protein
MGTNFGPALRDEQRLLEIDALRKYLNLWQRNKQNNAENCIMRSVLIYMANAASLLLLLLNQELMRWVAYIACIWEIRLLYKYFIPETCAFYRNCEFLGQHSDYELLKNDCSPSSYLISLERYYYLKAPFYNYWSNKYTYFVLSFTARIKD